MFTNLPPLHPALVHIPIAMLLLAAVFGAISLFVKREFWKDLAFKSLLVGVIFTPFAVFTGLYDEQKMAHAVVDEQLSLHKFNGLALMFFYQILLVWFWLRKKLSGRNEYMAWVICLLLGSGMVLLQGYLGGELVFTKGMGVKPVEESGAGHHGGTMNMNDSSGNMNMSDSSKKENEHGTPGHHGDSMKDMKDMDNMKDMNGMDNMKDMKGMDNMKDMKGMKNMKGMDNMKDMKGMENRKDMKGMQDMKGMDSMKEMKGMENMKNMKGMDMPGMKMPASSAMEKLRFPDNNPARKTDKKTIAPKN